MDTYEKKYNKLVEAVRELQEATPSDEGIQNWVKDNVPELKESDERIRKEIRDFICWTTDNGCITKYQCERSNSWLAWLEKQGEPIVINLTEFDSRLNKLLKQFETLPKEELETCLSFYLNVVHNNGTYKEIQGGVNMLSEEEQNKLAKGVLTSCALSFINYLDAHKYDGKMCVSNAECEDIENAFHNAMWDRLHRCYNKYIEKQDEQKKQRCGVSGFTDIVHAIETVYNEESADELEEYLTWLVRRKEENSAWTEEDEKMQNNIIELLVGLSAQSRTDSTSPSYSYPREIEWLKSIKDRIVPQPKQEWSEEDNKIWEDIFYLCNTFGYDDACRKLKSLRPQKHWKPSDEQMEMLKEACEKHWEPDGLDPLYTLYQDLKKLR